MSSITIKFSKDWQPKAARLAGLGWKVKPLFFPSLGKLRENFSKPWKAGGAFGKTLERLTSNWLMDGERVERKTEK